MKKISTLKRLLGLLGIVGSAIFAWNIASSRAAPVPESTALEPRVYLPLVLNTTIKPPALKWQRGGCYSSWCETGWYSSPAVANIDADPQVEILAGSYDLVALDGVTGALQWRAENGSRVWPGIALADLSGDGSLEIIVGRNTDQLTVYNISGGEVWSLHPFGAGEVRTLAVADLENDGLVEIIVGRASGGSTKQLNVFEPNGTVRPGWPARRDGEPGNGWGMYNQNAAVADVNNDGKKEIIGPTDTHYITALDQGGNQLLTNTIYNAFNPVGQKVWSQVGVHVDHAVDLRGYANCGTEHRPNFADSAPVIADIDNNGSREIIVVGNVYNCGTDPYTSLYQMPFILNADRSRWKASGFDWTAIPPPDPADAPISENYSVIETAEPNPALADLDGDGYQEILYASYDGRVHAYWLDKTEHGKWPYSVYKPAEGFRRFASEPVIADLNNDGKAEVLFTSWVQKGTYSTGKIHILDYLGNVIHEIDLPAAVGADWNGAMAAPTLANMDTDADLEMVLLTAHSGVVAYDLPGTANAKVLWGTGRGGYTRSGSK
jgi:hypothetical protein